MGTTSWRSERLRSKISAAVKADITDASPRRPLKLRNEPEEFYHASKRDPRVSLPRLKFLERD